MSIMAPISLQLPQQVISRKDLRNHLQHGHIDMITELRKRKKIEKNSKSTTQSQSIEVGCENSCIMWKTMHYL